jgi:anthranilate synthase component 2
VAKLLVIDNYDSFTWNLVHALHEAGDRARQKLEISVRRNDACTAQEAMAWQPDGIVLSPGPDSPAEAGITVDLIRVAAGQVPVFGVCLGHQSLAVAFGGRVVRAPEVMHGKTSLIQHDGRGLFAGLPDPLPAMRYHSLVVDSSCVPDALEVSATLPGERPLIMGLRHRRWPVEAVQFHPESIGTQARPQLADNALSLLLGLR